MSLIRKISNPIEESRKLYLTFDDGPDPSGTLEVLKILENFKAKATFFMVAERVEENLNIAHAVISQGHAIGNHSSDHRYAKFFQGKAALSTWMSESEKRITGVLQQETVGFRPPAGVVTPELIAAADALQLPLVLWNVRFFDTVFPWRKPRALSSLKRTGPGSIILLHDRQKPKKLPVFLDTLYAYCEFAQKNGFELVSLSRGLCLKEWAKK